MNQVLHTDLARDALLLRFKCQSLKDKNRRCQLCRFFYPSKTNTEWKCYACGWAIFASSTKNLSVVAIQHKFRECSGHE